MKVISCVMMLLYFLAAEDVGHRMQVVEEDMPNLQDINDGDVLLNSKDKGEIPKILRLSVVSDVQKLQNTMLYKGQYLPITYKLFLFDEAKITYTEFTPSIPKTFSSKESSVYLAQSGTWMKQDDESYMATFLFKINSTEFSIPSLVVHVRNKLLQDSAQSGTIRLSAQDLDSNKSFCGVIAKSFNILNVQSEAFDENHNTITVEIEASHSNLEDMKIKGVEYAEFSQDSKFSTERSVAVLRLRVPKGADDVKFSYFNIDTESFEDMHVPNKSEEVQGVAEHISPKDSFFTASNIIVVIIIGLLVMLTVTKRSFVSGIMATIVLGVFAYSIFSKTHTIITKPNARVTILPTETSTVLMVIPHPVKLDAINKKNGYYKVNVNSKTGWISENETSEE